MSAFDDLFAEITKGIKDLSSLEVTTYKGRVSIQAQDLKTTSFDAILEKASADADFRIAASSKSDLDGDTKVFFDKELGADEKEDHRKLVESAQKSRQAILDLFRDAITAAMGGK